ncbi:MAG: SH3 domain-containing protein [Lachnospiraceae bacterium]
MLKKYSKVLSVICAAAVVMTATVPVHASAFPSAGASPALEATSVKDQEATVADTTPVVMSVGGVSADKFTSIHSDAVQEVESEANTVIEDTVLVEETSEETTVSMNDIDMEYANLVIAKVNDYVNVRSDASEEAEIVGKLYDKSVGTYLSEKDGWYEIASGNCRGYVKAEYVVTGTDAIALAKEVGKRIATVTTTTLYVREMPSTESSVIGMVPIEDELTVVEEGVDEGWIKVSIEEGEGYVSSEFVTLSTEFVKAESKAEEEARLAAEEAARKKANAAAAKSAGGKSSGSSASVSGGSGTGSAVANYALQFVGNPYVYGGSSLTNGTDCSGFVMSVYAHFGVGLPHSSGAQRGCGYDVGGLGNAQPGDIVCYSGHVGIYIGGGQIVHASTAATGIKVSNAGYRQVLSVRRIF